MEKRVIAVCLLAVISLLLLSGCELADRYFEEQMWKRSGIEENADYQNYQEYKAAGVLDEEGYYLPNDEEQISRALISDIHVTFAENSNMTIRYYYDAEQTRPIDTMGVYLEPGDSIFANVSIKDDVGSNQYTFQSFRCSRFTEIGSRKPVDDIAVTQDGKSYEITIPDDFSESELSIEPIGMYEPRTISLHDYYMDQNDDEHPLNGVWYINDKEYDDDVIELDPITSYIISYEYDSDRFFFVSAEPDVFYKSAEDGLIVFSQRGPFDDTVDYSVELCEYLTISLPSNQKRTVWNVDDSSNDGTRINKNGNYSISHLQYNAQVILKTDTEWPELKKPGPDDGYVFTDEKQIDENTYQYTLTITQRNSVFVFDPEIYSYTQHGDIEFLFNNDPIDQKMSLRQGDEIKYREKQGTAQEGYLLQEGMITIGEENETDERLKGIAFDEIKPVTAYLRQPDCGGHIVYRNKDDDVIEDTEYRTITGDEITMEFYPWEGWYKKDVEKSYYITGKETRVDLPAGEIFKEDPGHKPTLDVTLDKSVGSDMQFTVTASGVDKTETWEGIKPNVSDLLGKRYLVKDAKIGTESAIVISMTDHAIPSGEAVRIEITKTDRNGNKYTETRYVTDREKERITIDIYDPDEIANSPIWYKSIEIMIGVVKVEKFIPAAAAPNTSITLQNVDTSVMLEDGDLIEGNQKVILTIAPSEGYYITDTKSGQYQDTMKYSEYVETIDNLIQKHPAAKCIELDLDTSDASFANYTYKLDGQVVDSDHVQARPGQKLELTYKITDNEHRLQETSGLLRYFKKSDNETTETITITEEMDGQTITKNNFGIEVEP